MRSRRPLIALLCSSMLCSCSSAPAIARKLSRATRPGPGPAASIGRYDAGCIAGAGELPLEGEGFRVMHPARLRYFGHPELVSFITRLGSELRRQGLPRMLVGDLGQPRGGPMLSGHASHQSGLDVDIWFRTEPGAWRPELAEELEAWSFVKNPELWGPAQTRMLQVAAQDERVERLFVNPELKLALCAAPGEKSWLAKLRPWSGHEDHFHARLRCPAPGPSCVSQSPPPPGDGCAEAVQLAQYFKEQAEKARLEPPPAPKPIELPEECAKLVESE